MNAWEQIQASVEVIEARLGEEITAEELARTASLSPFYYQRLFKRLVGKPVAEYIKLRRLAVATELLARGDERILDVALSLGFASHAHFTRAFKDAFGMTPNDYRRHPRALNRMTKPELALHYILVDEGVPLIAGGIVLEVTRRTLAEPLPFAGRIAELPVTFLQGLGKESGEDPLDTLWRDFHAQKLADPALLPDGEEAGVTMTGSSERVFRYFAGGLLRAGAVSTAFEPWEMPRGTYVVCAFEAEGFEALVMDALYKAEQYLYDVWLPGHGLRTAPFCVERYASHGAGTTGMEVWVLVG